MGGWRAARGVEHGMADEFHAQLRHTPRIPLLLKWKNAQQQVIIAGEVGRAPVARVPDLGRDILDYLRRPIVKPIRPARDIFPDRAREAKIKPREINADNRVPLLPRSEEHTSELQ